jgi:hypothetical protein
MYFCTLRSSLWHNLCFWGGAIGKAINGVSRGRFAEHPPSLVDSGGKTMKRLFVAGAAAACFALLFIGASVQAAGPPQGHGTSKSMKPGAHPAKLPQGKVAGARYHVRQYRGWNAYCWFPRYRCYGFYDPLCQGWFYWYEPLGRFLPTDSLPTNLPPSSGAALLPPGTGNGTTPTPPSPPVKPAPVPDAPPPVEPPPVIDPPAEVEPPPAIEAPPPVTIP